MIGLDTILLEELNRENHIDFLSDLIDGDSDLDFLIDDEELDSIEADEDYDYDDEEVYT